MSIMKTKTQQVRAKVVQKMAQLETRLFTYSDRLKNVNFSQRSNWNFAGIQSLDGENL